MPGPKGLLQEKFQRTAKIPNDDDGNSWIKTNEEFQSRVRKVYEPVYSEHYESSKVGAPDIASFDDAKLNYMPPGMFIDNNNPSPTERPYKYVAAGQSDVSNRVSPKMMKDGFLPNQMSPVDDMYNNEHVEEFYGEAKGEDDAGNKITGFLERNNYLDRN
jgi:hypothetical protein